MARTGLRYPGVIDLMIPSKDGCRLDLVLLDVGDIPDPAHRLVALQKNLVACIDFVADGQYREHAPDVDTSNITIRVVCRDEPTEDMRNLDAVRATDEGEAPIRIPVVVEAEPEFQARITEELGVTPPSLFAERKPWWKFW